MLFLEVGSRKNPKLLTDSFALRFTFPFTWTDKPWENFFTFVELIWNGRNWFRKPQRGDV